MSSMSGATGQVPKGYQVGQVQQFTPEQMSLFKSLFSQLGPESYLSRLAGGDEDLFREMEAPALKQFSGIQGGLASRFSGMGMGARRSSGFQNTQNQAASDFAQQLQSRRQDLQRQAIGDLFGLSSNLLGQRPFETTLTEKPKSFLEQLLISLSGGIGQGLGAAGSSFL